jgi:hypothetical protein
VSVTTSSYWWRADNAELQKVVDSANPVAQDMVTLNSVASAIGRTSAECKTALLNLYSTDSVEKVNNNVLNYGGFDCVALPLAFALADYNFGIPTNT